LFSAATNPCAGSKAKIPGGVWANIKCEVDGIVSALEQSGSDVSKGYTGELDTNASAIAGAYFNANLCPVNVHWHLGAEHRSEGEYDETFAAKGPTSSRRLAGDVRLGFRCKHYSAEDKKFTTPYEWKHCDSSMKVGETYEVHWPHSAVGACGTPWQYQTPFYDGVFCKHAAVTQAATDGVLNVPQAVGVQGQVFTIVNDEDFYYPDLIRGWINDGITYAKDVTYYTGSTTGTSRDNVDCSAYAPITWKVDRKCHLISASSFDKMCADMKAQADDMSDDLHPHGARELVANKFAANNHQDAAR